MGKCISTLTSPKGMLDEIDGTEKEYFQSFLEDRTLGQGEFGVVKLVHPMDKKAESMAVKILNKGLTFKDNTLFAPLSAENLKTECTILRKLNGEHFNLKLFQIYEARSLIYIVTELCSGGDMMQWVSNMHEDLSVEDVSRISFQILDAVNHCAKHNVIHRDIKPENIMFKNDEPSSELRLIDFGSSSMDSATESNLEHNTFAGSAFYTAPEMFAHKYTSKIDVWSVGVTLYVLVAGFPAESMQKAFNRLQSIKRNLKELPNMPDSLPESFFEMLEKLLTYKRKDRVSAEDIRNCEFAALFRSDSDTQKPLDISTVIADAQAFNQNPQGGSVSNKGTKIIGSVSRHASYLDYHKFERAVSTLLATVLSSKEYEDLLENLSTGVSDITKTTTEKRLKVIKVSKLRETLVSMGLERV